jgi:hypothetical protein
MKPWERKIAPLGFLLAAVLFVIAALLPVARGRPLNAAFFGVAVIFGVLGGVAWRRSGSEPPAQS